jgi:outer membrane lipoprotein SlyB
MFIEFRLKNLARASLSLTLVLIVGCAVGNHSPDVLSSQEAKRKAASESGVILDIRPVAINQGTEAAQATGAALGGLIANQATRDEELAIRTVATASGAAAGAVAGEFVNKTMLSKSAFELIIEMKSGSVVSVIQEDGRENLFAGADVWVITNSGRTRVILRESD